MIPKWTNGEIMPVQLVGVLETTLDAEDQSDDETEDDEQFINVELSSDSNDDSDSD